MTINKNSKITQDYYGEIKRTLRVTNKGFVKKINGSR